MSSLACDSSSKEFLNLSLSLFFLYFLLNPGKKIVKMREISTNSLIQYIYFEEYMHI